MEKTNLSLVKSIHTYAMVGDVKNLQILINAGANINALDENGYAPLHLAAQEGHLEVIRTLAKAGADTEIRDQQNNATPLHFAALEYNINAMRELINAGADVNVKVDHSSLIHFAADFGSSEVLQEIIQAGADINILDKNGNTPLHIAARRGYSHIIPLLVKAGANVNSIDSQNSATPFYYTIAKGDIKSVQALIKAGVDVHSESLKGKTTPIHLASGAGHNEILQEIIKAGANVSAVNAYGFSPLHLAAVLDDIKTIQLLINEGAKVNVTDQIDKATPLYYAIESKKFNSAMLLIINGADVNAKTPNGKNIIHSAIKYGCNSNLIKTILNNNDIDTHPHTSCAFAMKHENNCNQEVLGLLCDNAYESVVLS